jgi:spore coat polysaccharide biosynthesis protein SpsF
MYSDTHLCIQARMNSSRLPGKVIMKINGLPLIVYLYKRLLVEFNELNIVILTSSERSDDDLVDVMHEYNIPYFRGNLNNVLLRFYQYQKTISSDVKFIGRICADSPFLDTRIIREVLDNRRLDYDIMTTRYFDKLTLKSSVSKGNNFDLLNRETLLKLHKIEENFSDEDKEHVIFPFLRKKTLSLNLSNLIDINEDVAIDTLADIERLKKND